MTKQELRKYYLSLRDAMPEDERRKKSDMITERILSSDLYACSSLLLCYVSVGSEIDTYRLIETSLAQGKRTAVPYCIGREMKFREITSLKNLVPGKFNIPTADDCCPFVENFDDSLCIVPALSVDKNGNRLGYGGGYYDRFLSGRSNVRTIAVSFDDFFSEELPSESFDIKIPELITENRNLEVL